MENRKNDKKILNICITGIITALIIFFGMTGFGYIKVFTIEISFLSVFVAIGSILCGKWSGAFFGLIFGLTSFYQAFISLFGQIMLNYNVFFAFIVCVISRVLMGLICGLSYDLLKNKKMPNILKYSITSAVASVANTVFFVGFLVLLYGTNKEMLELFGANGALEIIFALISVNALIEVVVSIVVGAGISRILENIITKTLKEK